MSTEPPRPDDPGEAGQARRSPPKPWRRRGEGGAKAGRRRGEGGELRAITRLAVPAVLTQVATMFMGLVDTLMVSRLGTDAHGAGDGARCGLALQRGLVLAAFLSIPVAFLWAATGPALRLAGQDPALASLAHKYAVVQIVSIPPFLAFTALRQYLSGRGIMMPPMWVMLAANIVNVFLCWVLIFGHLGFEARGVVGSGVATCIARCFMFVGLLAYVLVARLHKDAWPGWSRRALDRAGVIEILRFGGPVGAQLGLEVWGFHTVTFMAGALGATALAAHSIVLNLASLTFNVPLGISIAAAFQVFDGTQVVGCGVLRGIGDTKPAALFNLIGYYVLAIPLGYVLTFQLGWGLRGLWWALVAGLVTVAALLIRRIGREA